MHYLVPIKTYRQRGLFKKYYLRSKKFYRIVHSELLAILVFDPFTELFITLCIAVNVLFMAMDHYLLEYDGM